jgi:hypothetical protein
MKRFTKFLMVALSYAPMATVAVAAQGKANELEGEIQSFKLKQKLDGARFRLLPTYHVSTSFESAEKRYSELTGLEGEDLTRAMEEDIENLLEAGLIQVDEKNIRASGPSEHIG